MSTVSSFLFTVGYVLGAVWELAHYALRFCWALLLPKAMFAARVLAAIAQSWLPTCIYCCPTSIPPRVIWGMSGYEKRS